MQVQIIVISDALAQDLGAPPGPPTTPQKQRPPAIKHAESSPQQQHASTPSNLQASSPDHQRAADTADQHVDARPQHSEDSHPGQPRIVEQQPDPVPGSEAASEDDILAELLGAAASDNQSPPVSRSATSVGHAAQSLPNTQMLQRPAAVSQPKAAAAASIIRGQANLPERSISPKGTAQQDAPSFDILEELLAAAGACNDSNPTASKLEENSPQRGLQPESADDNSILEELLSGQPTSGSQLRDASGNLAKRAGSDSNSASTRRIDTDGSRHLHHDHAGGHRHSLRSEPDREEAEATKGTGNEETDVLEQAQTMTRPQPHGRAQPAAVPATRSPLRGTHTCAAVSVASATGTLSIASRQCSVRLFCCSCLLPLDRMEQTWTDNPFDLNIQQQSLQAPPSCQRAHQQPSW